MEIADLDSVLAELYENQLIFHGFTTYMRDYEMVVHQPVDPNPKYGLVPRYLRFLFRYCTEATIQSRLRPATWTRSLSDDLLKQRHVSRESTGYIWGVEGQEIYPGVTVIQDSSRAAYWADQIGITFHEVLIEANAQAIDLVFAEATVTEVSPGYTPLVLVAGGHAETYASGATRALPAEEGPTTRQRRADVSFLHQDLQDLAVHTNNGEVIWPRSRAEDVINEISANGLIVVGLDLRSDGRGATPSGLATEVPWHDYRPVREEGSGTVADARQYAIESLRRPQIAQFGEYQWVLITWAGA